MPWACHGFRVPQVPVPLLEPGEEHHGWELQHRWRVDGPAAGALVTAAFTEGCGACVLARTMNVCVNFNHRRLASKSIDHCAHQQRSRPASDAPHSDTVSSAYRSRTAHDSARNRSQEERSLPFPSPPGGS